MSLSKNSKMRMFIAAVWCGGIFLAAAVSGCTLQPLYGKGNNRDAAAADNILSAKQGAILTGKAAQSGNLRSELAAVAVDMPNDRFNQIVRNRLIYLLTGGAGESASPRYHIKLNAGYSVQQAVQQNVGDTTQREGRASSGTIIASADYVLRQRNDAGDDTVIQQRRRSVTSSFDRPRQEYANLTAEENAKKRAAEELAESVYLSLAQALGKQH